ncbi:alpha/beta hydrolase family protein [Bdellovibrio sp. HCB185ZH]|uniref:alpha/beta hydrolase family protein n=1 Tax=Bdellovibrio sp. HCB185ZH TaxID=3394235 RepID=UPI0039A73C52
MKISVTFNAEDRLLEAGLYIPDNNSHEEPLAAFLVEGAMTGGASQISDKLARAISDEGVVCMVLDHAFYNDDQEAPMSWESPTKRIADIVAALQFLKEHSIVNPEKIVALGISVGAEYMAKALELTNLCRGFIVIHGKNEEVPDFNRRVDVPITQIMNQNVETTAQEAVTWTQALFNLPHAFGSREFKLWDHIEE